MVEFAGYADDRPPQLDQTMGDANGDGDRSSGGTSGSYLDDADQELLSRWTATLAAGDPKAFERVVSDVIKRMRRLADSDAPIIVRHHASAAAASLDIVLAATTGEIAEADAEANRDSFALLLARLAALGILTKFPEMGVIVAAGKLILAYMGRSEVAQRGSPGAQSSAAEPDLQFDLRVTDSPSAIPPTGIAPITVQALHGGVPAARARVRATAFSATFQENRGGRWTSIGQLWAGETGSDGRATANVAPQAGADSVLIEFEAEGVRAECRLPVRNPT